MSLSHRGPDFNDHIFVDKIFFYILDFQFIDLDKRANQPFFSNDRKNNYL